MSNVSREGNRARAVTIRSAPWQVGIALIALGPLVACGGLVAPANSEATAVATDAAPVLRAMGERYATCRSYDDKGTLVVAHHYDDGSDSSGSRITFETAFDRATGGFRFEWTKTRDRFFSPEQGAIWRRTVDPAHTWRNVEPAIQDTALNDAIHRFSGVSLGTAYHVPSMLFGLTVIGGNYSVFRDLGFHLDGEETIGGMPCIKLSAKATDRVVTLWIGRDDHALRKVLERRHEDSRPLSTSADEPLGLSEEQRGLLAAGRREPPHPYTTEIKTEYVPAFDRVVDPTRFEFTPPPEPPARTP